MLFTKNNSYLIDRKISLDSVHPIEIFGANNDFLKRIQEAYPSLKIIARGSEITLKGDESSIDDLEQRFLAMIVYVSAGNKMTLQKIDSFLMGSTDSIPSEENEIDKNKGFLMIGTNGKPIVARTSNQLKLLEASLTNDLIFAIGPAGTGKTYTAVAIAVKALKQKEIKRIIIARPAVEAGENLGFLPGDLKEKIDPYLRPVYDALDDMIPSDKLKKAFEDRVIEVAPLAFMRGRTLNNAYVILDEAQNATDSQLKMFLTRMGPNAKFFVTGDITQIDLPKPQYSGLTKSIKILQNVKGVAVVQLSTEDVLRHKLVKEIIKAYEKSDETKARN